MPPGVGSLAGVTFLVCASQSGSRATKQKQKASVRSKDVRAQFLWCIVQVNFPLRVANAIVQRGIQPWVYD